MRFQSRFFRVLIVAALSVTVSSSLVASAFCTHSVDAGNSAIGVAEYTFGATGYSYQDGVPAVIPPLPDTVMNRDLTALDGSSFKLADYRGSVILVNLWASWCGPCRSDIPHLIKISQEFNARGVEVIGLTSEDPETYAEQVQDFVDEFKINYRIGWSEQSFVMALMQGQIRNNIPQTFVISRDGRVLKRFVGFNLKETPPKMRQAVEEALNEK